MRLFSNYHKHCDLTNPRISDCCVKLEDYAKRAVELGHGLLSSCEHGYQGNVFLCHDLAKQYGLKFLVGAEAYWVRDREVQEQHNGHIFIGARNENGRECLNDILSEANLTGFYKQPRIDIPLILSLPRDDVWVTSACIAGWRYDDAEDIFKRFADHFGDNFMLEVQYHNTQAQQALNERILKLHYETGIDLVMGCDSHYIYPSQEQNRVDFLASKEMHYEDEDGWYLDYPDGDEAYKRFAKQGVLSGAEIDQAIDNSNVFLTVEEYDSPVFDTKIKLPTLYPDKSQEEKDAIYKDLIWTAWDKYKEEVPAEEHEHYIEEISKEVQTVVDTHMADYFIMNHYIIQQGQKNGGKLTKSGRGSAVSFITNKLLGFTAVDRVSANVKMYPERFMSTTRILQSGSLPDIDFNVAPVEPFAKAQKEVLGEDHAYPMIAYGTMKKSAAWKLYAKSQNVPFDIANKVSEQLERYEMALKHADEDEKEFIKVEDFIDANLLDIYSGSKDYNGLISSWSIAPCSYLLYSGSIRREVGLVKIKDHICCNMDGHAAENGHFLKNDLLKVSVVELIYNAYHKAGLEPPSVNELLEMCKNDNSWKMYSTKCTLGLNQVEKQATSSRVAKYKPQNISELCAFIAAIRPGFKSMYKTFESREPFAYGVKAIDDILQTAEMPNSFCMYQEQEMAALNFAGIDMSDCYTAIKNIAKKRTEKVLAYKDRFLDGFKQAIIREGKSEQVAEELATQFWRIIEDSASYSFNASHSYCVAIDSLYSAWIKCHHPMEFYETLIEIYEAKGVKDKITEAKVEAEEHFGIKFPPMRFGQDGRKITMDYEHKEITTPLSTIKGFGKMVGDVMYDCAQTHPATFIDILRYCDEHGVKTSYINKLILINYFAQFGNIPTMLRISEMWDFFKQGKAKTMKKDKLSPELKEIISHHANDVGATGNILLSYTITDMDGLLNECMANIYALNLDEMSYKLQAENQLEILGKIDLFTGNPADRQKLLITGIKTRPDKFKGGIWKHTLYTKSLGTGKESSVDIYPNQMIAKPVKRSDIVYCKAIARNKRNPEFWEMKDYDVLE